ncbi:conserved hypothetical protein [sediment metagenome]|uniref:Nucleotidyltransferase n=1 Tax=sediment metagenome TaxID=749907 RepID=D9PG74_9ZZZZ
MYLTPEYKEIIELFNKYNVKFLVVGAYAMSAFGYSRSTYDIDLYIEKSDDNAINIVTALEDFGIGFEVNKKDFIEDNSIIQIGVAPIRIDILTDIDGVMFEEVYKNKTLHDFGDVKAFIISIDDIIKNKKSTNRLKDKIDVEELMRIKEK